jgi:uncharacterized membrane protein
MAKGRQTTKPTAAGRTAGRSTGGASAERRDPERVVFVLAVLGTLLTAYLSAIAWLGTPPAFCTEGSGCDLVQQSQWSRVLGLPVAFWGFLLYALLALIALRMPPRLKRWRRLWFLALPGVAISVYLTGAAWFALGTFCGWCLLSLATISAILLAVLLRRPGSAPGMSWGQWLLRSAGVSLAAVVALHLYATDALTRPEDSRLAALAMHLEASGARYYGASWCPSCRDQRRLFGVAGERLPYVECSPGGRGTPMAQSCVAAGIAAFPTWIIRGRRYEEVLRPEELARLSGFDWQGFKR